MNKICNFRPLFFACVSVLTGLICSYFLLIGNFLGAVIAFSIVAVFLFTLITLICIKHKREKRFPKKSIVMLLICVIVFVVAFSSFQIKASSYNVSDIDISEISGYVSRVNGGSSYQIITLTNVRVENKKISKNVTVYVSGSSEIIEGNKIKFVSELENQKLVSNNEINSYMIFDNTAYACSLSASEIEILSYSPTISLRIRNYVLERLSENYSNKNTALVFAMLFGNKTLLKDFDVASYNEIGIAHIFAVSGLHISIIFMIIAFVLSKLKVRGKFNFVLTAIISVSYCALCGFSASVVRATVMSLCLLFAKLVHRQGDSFNAYCIAFLILTFLNPFNFLHAGFQLSFLCVFAILSLSPPLSKLLSKKLPEKIANSLAVSISAFIGTFIVLVKIYGFFNPLSILFNMLLIPIFSALFIIIFVFNLIVCIVPPLSFINQAPNFFLTLYELMVGLFAKIPAVITMNNLGVACLISFILFIFIAGNFCLLKTWKKTVISCTLIVLSLTSGIICAMPTNFNTVRLTAIRSNYENCYLLTDSCNSRIAIVNNLNSATFKTLTEYMENNKISYLTHIVARKVATSQSQLEMLQNLTKHEIITLQPSSFVNFEEYEQKELGNYKFSVLNSILKENGVVATVNNKNILFVFSKLNGAGNEEYLLNYDSFEIICSQYNNYVNIQSNKIVVFKENSESAENIINTKNEKQITLIP